MIAITSTLKNRPARPLRVGSCALGFAVAWLGPSGAASAFAAQDPSFECKGELTTVERVICTHGDLAALDVELAAAYREALARAPTLSARKALQTDQARWRGRRNECDAQQPMQDCIAAEYKARLAQLRAAGSASSPARAGGNKQHSRGIDAGVLAADLATNQLWVWLLWAGSCSASAPSRTLRPCRVTWRPCCPT
jgi:uncharacterized protein